MQTHGHPSGSDKGRGAGPGVCVFSKRGRQPRPGGAGPLGPSAVSLSSSPVSVSEGSRGRPAPVRGESLGRNLKVGDFDSGPPRPVFVLQQALGWMRVTATHVYAHQHTHTPPCTPPWTHTWTHTYPHIYVHTHHTEHQHVHTWPHTCAHMHKHTHTRMGLHPFGAPQLALVSNSTV